MATEYSPQIVTNGLVLCLDAANPKSYVSGSTVWNNLTKTAPLSGSLINGPTFNSANLGSIVFDGVDDYVNCGTIPFTSNTFTIEVVFNWDSYNTNAINFLTAGGVIEQLEIHTGGGSGINGLRFIPYSFGGSGLQSGIDALNMISSGINYVTFTAGYSSPSVAYKNGSLFATSATTSSVALNTNQTFNIGRRTTTNQYFLNGKIYLTRIYNRVLSPTEVQQNFNALRGRYGI